MHKFKTKQSRNRNQLQVLEHGPVRSPGQWPLGLCITVTFMLRLQFSGRRDAGGQHSTPGPLSNPSPCQNVSHNRRDQLARKTGGPERGAHTQCIRGATWGRGQGSETWRDRKHEEDIYGRRKEVQRQGWTLLGPWRKLIKHNHISLDNSFKNSPANIFFQLSTVKSF